MNCPICGSSKTICKYSNNKTSLCRYGFMPNRKDATSVPRNLELEILECIDCNFAWNTKFKSSKVNYSNLPILESALHTSVYLNFQKEQALWLSSKINLETKSVLEIGGGSGYFMNHINAKERIIYEPSMESKNISDEIKLYNKYFDPNLDKPEGEVIIMRQVLEHIEEPFKFINTIINNTSFQHGYIYIEVPSYDQTKNRNRFYDFYYEHCNYFSLNSLAKMALLLKLNIISLESHFNNELNICLMEYQTNISENILLSTTKVNIQSKIQALLKSGKNLVIWGASGNGVAVLNELNIDYQFIPYVIDDDKRKQGKYIPFTGQQIVSSEDCNLSNIDCVFIASQLHIKTIAKKCHDKFGDKVQVYNLEGEIIPKS